MKKIFIFLSALFVIVCSFAAPKNEKKIVIERPDMEKIKAEVLDPASKYYYPKLMAMYQQNETIMNLDQYRHLYLGMVFQEDYNPYRHSSADKQNEQLIYDAGRKHTREEFDSIISFAERALADDPFDLTQMNYLIYGLRGRGKDNRAAIWQYRLNHILEAIVSTGTGIDTENAWYVINPRHEYNIINFQNCIAEGQQYVEPYFDYIRIKPAAGKPEGYFFNIHYILEEYYRKFPEQM